MAIKNNTGGWKNRLSVMCFTLVELLVVIAVIVVLMAILLPALQSARGTAKSIICVGSLKNLHIAEMSYIGDCFEWFTPAYPGLDEDSHSAFYWTNLLYPYLGGKGTSRDIFRASVNPDNSVYFCPSQVPHDTWNGAIHGATNDYPSYGLNVSLGGRNGRVTATRLGAIKKPSAIVVFADVQYGPDIPLRGYRTLSGYYFSARHSACNNSNVIWVDGHVSSVNTLWAKANDMAGADILDYTEFSSNW